MYGAWTPLLDLITDSNIYISGYSKLAGLAVRQNSNLCDGCTARIRAPGDFRAHPRAPNSILTLP